MAHLRGFANQVRAGFWVVSVLSLGPLGQELWLQSPRSRRDTLLHQ